MNDFPVFLAHDHMQKPEDYAQDLSVGVTGKIIHLTIDGWIDAHTQEEYDHAYHSYDGFRERGLEALTNLHAIAAEPDNKIRVIREFGDLAEAQANGQLAVIAGNEGGKLLGDKPELLDAWFQLGLRHVQFNWSMANKIGASQSEEDDPSQPGLTEFGRQTVTGMNEKGMIVDVSHSAPQTIKDVLEVTSKPILNSHSGGRAIADKQQNLWDEQIVDMANNGGVVAIHFCSRLVLGVNGVDAEIDVDPANQIRGRCRRDRCRRAGARLGARSSRAGHSVFEEHRSGRYFVDQRSGKFVSASESLGSDARRGVFGNRDRKDRRWQHVETVQRCFTELNSLILVLAIRVG